MNSFSGSIEFEKRYFKFFNYVLVGVIICFFARLIPYYFFIELIESESVSKKFSAVFNSFPDLIMYFFLWTAIGLVLKYRKASAIGFGLSLLGLVVELFFFNPTHYSALGFITTNFFSMLPFLVFGNLVFKDKRAIYFVVVAVIIFGMNSISFGFYQGADIISSVLSYWDLSEIFSLSLPSSSDMNSTTHIDCLLIIVSCFRLPIAFLIFVEIFISSKNRMSFIYGNTIDFSSNYSKYFMSIVFVIFSLSIYYLCIGGASQMDFLLNSQMGLLVKAITGLIILLSIYVVALTYRNFLAVYWLSRNRKLGLYFLFWNIPVINCVAWIVSLFSFGPLVSFNKRLDIYRESQASGGESAKVFIFIVGLIYLMVTLVKVSYDGLQLDFMEMWGVILTVLFYLLYIFWNRGLLIFLTFAVVQIFMVFGVKYSSGDVDVSFEGLNFYVIGNAVILYILFHSKYVQVSGLTLQKEANQNFVKEEE